MINTAPGAPAKEAEPIKPTLNEVARSATAVAAQLEHSQAEQPMVDLARGLQTSQAPTLCFTVLAASQVARDALLRWLVGPHHALVQVEGAAALGVDRASLWRALTGQWHLPKLVARYTARQKERSA